MDVETVVEVVGDTPHTKPKRGRQLYEFIVNHRIQDVLELGFAHGVSACYLGAAVHEVGGNGRVVAMDRTSAIDKTPNIKDLTERCGIDDLIEPVLANRSFTWELMRLLRDQPSHKFDFCFLDGGHSWDVTGYSFLLVDYLLRPGGWLLFDDLAWTYSDSPSMQHIAAELPQEEAEAAQVGLVFDLLVGRHADYHTYRDGNWGWAQKRGER